MPHKKAAKRLKKSEKLSKVKPLSVTTSLTPIVTNPTPVVAHPVTGTIISVQPQPVQTSGGSGGGSTAGWNIAANKPD